MFHTEKKSSSLSNASSAKSPFPTHKFKVPGRQSIALISEHSDPAAANRQDQISGQNVYVREVGEALAKLGWQVDMFTRKTHPDDPSIVEHSPHCRTIRLAAGPQTFMLQDQLFPHLPEFVQAFHKFQTKEGANYPLVHTHGWMSGWIGLQLRQQSNIQLVHTFQSLGAIEYPSTVRHPAIAQTRLATEQHLLEKVDCVVATSPEEELQLRSLISKKGYVEVIPCGADLETFHIMPRVEARNQLGFALTDQIVLYVGRFDASKGIETLIQAFARVKQGIEQQASIGGVNFQLNGATGKAKSFDPANLRLVLVGGDAPEHADSQEQQRLEQLVRELGLTEQTLFAGRVGHDLLPLYYTAADVCVIPSQYEPFGLVAIEAMACGTPVVASDVGGLKFTVVPEETGLLVPPGQIAAFTGAIDRVLTDEVWARRLRRQASNRVQQNFSWTGVAVKLSDLYRRLLAQSIAHEFFQNQPPRLDQEQDLNLLSSARLGA
jgi:glycosyltransferase involved in cell wall biosynthesis